MDGGYGAAMATVGRVFHHGWIRQSRNWDNLPTRDRPKFCHRAKPLPVPSEIPMD